MDITDSVVLVTGGNRGLGKALVQASLRAGARKIYVGLNPQLFYQQLQADWDNTL